MTDTVGHALEAPGLCQRCWGDCLPEGCKGTVQTAHWCPACGEQCSCVDAVVRIVGEEQEPAAEGCTHDCVADREARRIDQEAARVDAAYDQSREPF